VVRLGHHNGAHPKDAPVSARIARLQRAHEPPTRQLGDILLGIFAGLTATALEKVLTEIHKGSSEDSTTTRMFSLLQANCVASIIFAMTHFMLSLVRQLPPRARRSAWAER
jgi:hypothetical protein